MLYLLGGREAEDLGELARELFKVSSGLRLLNLRFLADIYVGFDVQ